MDTTATTKRGSNYAWVVAITGGFLPQLTALFCVQLWGMNLTTMADSFGVQTTDLAIGSSLFGLIYGILVVFWGNVADRIGIRKELTISCLGVGIVLLVTSFVATTPLMAIVGYAIAGFFMGGIALGILPKIVSTWFATHSRGKGMAVTAVGGSLGGVIFGAVAPQVILSGGWQLCFQFVGVVLIVVGIIAFVFVRDNPAVRGEEPFGIEKEPENTVGMDEIQKDIDESSLKERLSRVVKNPNAWKMAVIFILYQIYYMGHVTFFVTALQHAGFDLAVAGIISSVVYVGICIGQIFFPSISDRFARKNILGGLLVCAGFVYGSLYFVLQMQLPTSLLIGLMAVAGVLFACNAMMQSTMTELFPPDLRGFGPGLVNACGFIGKFFGPIILSAVIVATGGSAVVFPLVTGPCAIVAGLLALLTLPKTSGKYGDPLAEEYARQRAEKLATSAADES